MLGPGQQLLPLWRMTRIDPEPNLVKSVQVPRRLENRGTRTASATRETKDVSLSLRRRPRRRGVRRADGSRAGRVQRRRVRHPLDVRYNLDIRRFRGAPRRAVPPPPDSSDARARRRGRLRHRRGRSFRTPGTAVPGDGRLGEGGREPPGALDGSRGRGGGLRARRVHSRRT
jgi:hypothetical protein